MELTANRRPFLYFPLAHHFEQTFHVPHRLDRYRAGQRMTYTTTDADAIAAAIAAEIGRDLDYPARRTRRRPPCRRTPRRTALSCLTVCPSLSWHPGSALAKDGG